MKPLREFAKEREIFVAAHRGSSNTAPENTLAAFDEAIKAGTDMIELDIQFTKDGEIVVYHDENIRGFSEPKKINALNYSELKEFDAGSWFNKKFEGERIPLFKDAVEFIKNKAYIVIEVKSYANNFIAYTKKFVEEIRDLNIIENFIAASFDYNLLRELRRLDKRVATAAIKIPGSERLPSAICKEIKAPSFICSIDELDEEISNDCRQNGIYIGVYGAETESDLNKAIKYGAIGVGTNDPSKIIGLLKSKGKI